MILWYPSALDSVLRCCVVGTEIDLEEPIRRFGVELIMEPSASEHPSLLKGEILGRCLETT